MKSQAPPKAAEPEIQKPDPEKFKDEQGQFKAFEYAEALAAYAATEAVAKDRAKQEQDRRAAQAAESEKVARGRVDEARKRHADYDRVMESTPVNTHPQVLQYLTASENIGELAYYLAKNPDFVERINKMHPFEAIAEIGRLEPTLGKPRAPATIADPPPAPKASGAPPPITPLQTSSAGTVQTDPSKMSFRELRDYERTRKRR